MFRARGQDPQPQPRSPPNQPGAFSFVAASHRCATPIARPRYLDGAFSWFWPSSYQTVRIMSRSCCMELPRLTAVLTRRSSQPRPVQFVTPQIDSISSPFFEDTAVRRLHIIKRTAPSLFQRFAQRRFLNDLIQQRTVVSRITIGA